MKIPMKAVAMVVAAAFFCANITWAAGGDFKGMSLRKQAGYTQAAEEEIEVSKNRFSYIPKFVIGALLLFTGIQSTLPSAQAFIGGSDRRPVLLATISDFTKDNVQGSFAENAGMLENEKITEAREEFQEVWQELLPQAQEILKADKDGRKHIVAEKLIIESEFYELVAEANTKFRHYLTALKYYSAADAVEVGAIGNILQELMHRVGGLHNNEKLLRIYEDDWNESALYKAVIIAFLISGFATFTSLLLLDIIDDWGGASWMFISVFLISLLGGRFYYGGWGTVIRHPAQTRVYKVKEGEISWVMEYLKKLNNPGLLSAHMKVLGLSTLPMDSYQRPLYAEALLSSI